jgi:hypothetical protein
MKFEDNMYLYLRNTNGEKISHTNFYIYQFGHPDDDISIDLTINDDNTMDLEYDQKTLTMFNDPSYNISQDDRNKLLIEMHQNLIEFPYINDEWELRYRTARILRTI